MDPRNEITRLLADSHGVVARYQHPELRASLEHLLRRQGLTTVLPGIYAVPSLAARTEIKIRAAMLCHPDGVYSELRRLRCPTGRS